MSTRRETDTFEFDPAQTERVAGYLHHLTEAGQGWINLMPGLEEEDDGRTTMAPGVFALFTARQPPITMGTLMPPRPNRREYEGVTIGLLHPTGSKAAQRLADGGVALPDGWRVRQDHARRGLVVLARHGESEAAVLSWTLQAGTVLCRKEMTGQWQAVVYLP
ncbi:MAG TPA: hypothetical protein VHV57_02340 [Acidimicrobiales bacterium]|jgi:hypothetical protein|nr:hypothetical protein [Acidimicrobiales bacterium]